MKTNDMDDAQSLQAFKRALSLEWSKWYKELLTTALAGKDDANGSFSLVARSEQAFTKMTRPAERLEVPEWMEADSTDDLMKVVEILSQYGIRVLTQEEIAEQLPLYPHPFAPWSIN
jgi:hypothetical protein